MDRMPDWYYLEQHYNELVKDTYPQPIDLQHFSWMQDMIEKTSYLPNCKSVLDIGCGQGDAQELFQTYGMSYIGITVGEDFKIGRKAGKTVYDIDFNFLPDFWTDKFDLVWARHSLEHSPFPLLSLMEFHRVSKKWLCLILPNPDHFSYIGRNHYSVLPAQQARWLLRRAGWKIMWKEITETELRFICEKKPRLGHEGYAQSPLPGKIYEEDRDG